MPGQPGRERVAAGGEQGADRTTVRAKYIQTSAATATAAMNTVGTPSTLARPKLTRPAE